MHGKHWNEEISGLLPLFTTSPLDDKAFSKVLDDQQVRYGRLGIENRRMQVARLRDELVTYFLSQTSESIAQERSFLERLLATDIDSSLANGYARGRSVMPVHDYSDPHAVLVWGGHTDACVLDDGLFAINLNMVYEDIKNQHPADQVEKALRQIESDASHESNHLYLDQLPVRETPVHWLYHTAFCEGLATRCEIKHHPTHEAYLPNITYWSGLVDRAVAADSEPSACAILAEIAQEPTLARFRKRATRELREALARGMRINDVVYNEWLNRILLHGNGPIYHVGYHMWEEIEAQRGPDEAKGLVVEGPEAFVAAYRFLSTNRPRGGTQLFIPS